MNLINNLSIRAKIPLGFTVVLAIVVFLGLVSINRLGAVNQNAEEIRDSWLPSTGQISKLLTSVYSLRLREARYLLVKAEGGDVEKLKADMASGAERIAQARASYTPLIVVGSSSANLIQQFDREWEKYAKTTSEMLELANTDNKGAIKVFNNASRDDFSRVIKPLNDLADFNVVQGKNVADLGASIFAATTWTVIQTIGFAAAICVLLGWLLVASVSTPIQRITIAMKRLAGRDLSIGIDGLGRKDEIGAMASALQIFKDSMIAADQMSADKLQEQNLKEQRASRIQAINVAFDHSASGALDYLASAATELSATASSMSHNTEVASRQANAVAVASEEASINVRNVATATTELSSSIQDIARRVLESTTIAGEAVNEAASTSQRMRALSDSVQKIGEVVRLIGNIATQTNLLALNATIEASRAGESGKGFAVVASEVKLLATQTAKATDDISIRVAAMQTATGEAVDAIDRIDATIGRMKEISSSIAVAIEQQDAATRNIARNVQEAANGTTGVSQNVTGLRQNVGDTGAASREVLDAASQLGTQAEKLRGSVQMFLADIRSA